MLKKGKIRFLLSAHETEADANRILKKLPEKGRIFVETANPESEKKILEDFFEKLKEGKILLNPKASSFDLELFSKLAGNKKLDYFFESITNEQKENSIKIKELSRESEIHFIEGDFEKSVGKAREESELETQLTKERDERIGKELKQILEKNPEEDVNVVIGAGHSTILRSLKKKGVPAERVSISNLITYAPSEEIINRKRENKLTKEKEEWLLSASSPHSLLCSYLQTEGVRDSIEMHNKARKVINRMTVIDFKELSKYLGKYGPYYSPEDAGALVASWIKKKGIAKEEELR